MSRRRRPEAPSATATEIYENRRRRCLGVYLSVFSHSLLPIDPCRFPVVPFSLR
ncbi:hypothetical protein HanIR_Chr03g0104321 [Helianthus annuus]|nr:hypothetical protein HanIR_Chr03g0104321 [Helianthus annuus]